MTQNDIWLLHSTFATKGEAISVARMLLEKRLIACANLYENVSSLYRWQGELKEEQETVLIAKTQKKMVPAAIQAIKNIHSYDLPCIVAYPIARGLPEFLKWVEEETTSV